MDDTEWKQARVVVGLLLITIVCIAMAGCGGAPFAKVGGYLHRGPHSEPLARWEVGYEWERVDCSYTHLSQPSEGSPFNKRPDFYVLDALGCSYKFGGLK
jgi:hypothetical protein